MIWILPVYALASIITFCAYALDKHRARRGRWRVPESTLQTMALCGGFAGALLGRRLFKHKTTKRRFTIVLYAIVTLHVLAWVVWWTQVKP